MQDSEQEAESVRAEVIEDEAESLAVEYVRLERIEANFDALEAHVRRVVSDYEGATYDLTNKEAVKAAKRDRSYLNGLKKEIDERRKAVKREYSKPLEAFESRCKAVTGIIDEASEGIKAQLDRAEQERQDAAYAALQEHYEEFAGLLVPVVPYERLHEAQWLNKTFGERKAFAALEAKVAKLDGDWKTLKTQFEGEPFYADAERELFATLDLGAALTAARKAAEESARIAELKAAMEPEPEPVESGDREDEQPAPMPMQETAYAPEPMPMQEQPAPAPAPMPAQPAPAPCPAPEAGEPWTVTVPSATRSQMQAVAAALKAQGVAGTIMRGTVAQVYERTNGGM